MNNITLLHVAAITSDVIAAEKLIAAGADVDARDCRGWTPLHHAAFANYGAMMSCLLQNGADGTLLNDRGATYKDILDLIYPQPVDTQEVIPLLWRGEKGEISPLTQEKFSALTSAEFIAENRITPQQIRKDWFDPEDVKNELSFTEEIKNLYLAFSESPSKLILSHVTHDASSGELPFCPGLGLFAFKALAPKEVIGEYKGKICEEEPAYNSYVLRKIDAEKMRNAIAIANDGFPNAVMVPIHNVEGLPFRAVLIAAEPIKQGEQLCWHYGFHRVKLARYVELRPKEVRDFIQSENIQELIHYMLVSSMSGQLSFENFVRTEKFRYILQTPPVLFALIFEGVVDDAKALFLEEFVTKVVYPSHAALEYLYSLGKIAREGASLIKELELFAPCFARVYREYFKALLARFGIRVTLSLLDQNTQKLQESFNLKGENLSLHRLWKGGEEPLLDLWDKIILPKNEAALAE